MDKQDLKTLTDAKRTRLTQLNATLEQFKTLAASGVQITDDQKPITDSINAAQRDIDSLTAEVTKLEAAAASGVAVTEFKPEPAATGLSLEAERWKEHQGKLKMYAASCNREIQRIRNENAVRIGDSQIAEQTLVFEIVTALQKCETKYLSMVD